MPHFNLKPLARTLSLCLTVEPQRFPRSIWQGMLCEPRTTDDTTNAPKPRSHPAIGTESCTHSSRVLFLVALRHLLQMLSASRMAKFRLGHTTAIGTQPSSLALLLARLAAFDSPESIALAMFETAMRNYDSIIAPQLSPFCLRYTEHSSYVIDDECHSP